MNIHPITQRFIDVFNYLIAEKYFKNEAAALKQLNVEKQDLYNILEGKKDISLPILLAISKIGINPTYLITGEGNIGWIPRQGGRSVTNRLSTKTIADIINLDVESARDKEIVNLIDQDIKLMIEYLIKNESIKDKWDLFYHLILLYDTWYKNLKKTEEEEASKDDFKTQVIFEYEKIIQKLEEDIQAIHSNLSKRMRQFSKLKGEYDKLI